MTTPEPTDPDAGRAMPTDPNDVALDADCRVPGYWPTNPPTLPDPGAAFWWTEEYGVMVSYEDISYRFAGDTVLQELPDDAVRLVPEQALRAQLDAAVAEQRYLSQQLQASVGRECNALCNDIEQDRDELERELATLRAQLDASIRRDWLREELAELGTERDTLLEELSRFGRCPACGMRDLLDGRCGTAMDSCGFRAADFPPESFAPPAEGECPGPVPGHGCDDCRSDQELHPERFQ